MLLLPEGHMGEAWDPSKKQCCLGSLKRKARLPFL